MYTAVVLDSKYIGVLQNFVYSATDLINKGFSFSNFGQVLPHHMTINLGDFDSSLNPESILNQRANLFLDKLVFDENLGVCAATVSKYFLETGESFMVSNKHPHITVCLKPYAKPKLSNDMLNSGFYQQINLGNLKVSGTITVCD